METGYQLEVLGNQITVSLQNGGRETVESRPFPEPFLQWQAAARMKMFDLLQQSGAQHARTMPGHLPTLATLGGGALFPVNLTTRGLGVLPKESLLADITEKFIRAREQAADLSAEESLSARVDAIRAFYGDAQNFDPYLLGGLEIFEGQTARNIAQNPFVSLLYSGEAPVFPSYQFNGVMRVVPDADPYYRFLLAARELFAFDAFHVHQIRYPFGYLFYLVEEKNKTPFSRKPS